MKALDFRAKWGRVQLFLTLFIHRLGPRVPTWLGCPEKSIPLPLGSGPPRCSQQAEGELPQAELLARRLHRPCQARAGFCTRAGAWHGTTSRTSCSPSPHFCLQVSLRPRGCSGGSKPLGKVPALGGSAAAKQARGRLQT